MKCEICGTENPDNKKFCSNCGSSLTDENFNNGDEVFVSYDAEQFKTMKENAQENRRKLLENRQSRRIRERAKKQKSRAVILSVLIAAVMTVIIINTVYICVKRASLPQQETVGFDSVLTGERRTSV